METLRDPILNAIVKELVQNYRCHTVVLYGSRARGLQNATSDYDVFGVRKTGKKTRIAKKQKGFFWDVFVYPEKDLKTLSAERFDWKNARPLYQKGPYGKKLLQRLDKLLKTPFKPHPKYEVAVVKVWAQKQLERCRMNDIQGIFRRAEFSAALVEHYFYIRQKRFNGPKEGFAWIKNHDPKVYKLIHRALMNPKNLNHLKSAAASVYKTKLS